MLTLLLSSSDSDIAYAAKLLQEGETVAFPTETVYGLGACIFDEVAVKKIFVAKGRPSDNPLIAHVFAPEQAAEIARDIPTEYAVLSEAFFPGPLTVVLRRKSNVPAIVSGGLDTIAIRMPAHSAALKLIEQAGQPVVAPSANKSGRPSPTCAKHVLDDLNGEIAAVIDGGKCDVGIESTVVSLIDLERPPVILRPGSISAEEIAATLQCSVEYSKNKDAVASPGMRYRHYAPNAKVELVFPKQKIPEIGDYSVVLASSPPQEIPNSAEFRFLSAATLYAELRRADKKKASAIFILLTPDITAQTGLMNRLTQAACIVGEPHK